MPGSSGRTPGPRLCAAHRRQIAPPRAGSNTAPVSRLGLAARRARCEGRAMAREIEQRELDVAQRRRRRARLGEAVPQPDDHVERLGLGRLRGQERGDELRDVARVRDRERRRSRAASTRARPPPRRGSTARRAAAGRAGSGRARAAGARRRTAAATCARRARPPRPARASPCTARRADRTRAAASS